MNFSFILFLCGRSALSYIFKNIYHKIYDKIFQKCMRALAGHAKIK